MGANITVFAQINHQRKDPSGRVPIRLRIDLDNKPIAYDKMGDKSYKIPVQFWDADKRCVHKSFPNAAILNNIIDKRIAELEGIFILKEQAGMKMNKRNIKALVSGNDPGKCFFTFSRDQIKAKYDNKETKRTYESELTKMEEYCPDVSFRDIDYKFLQDYKAWMRDIRGNRENTIWKSFKFINTMLNDAISIGGIIDENPFKEFDRGSYKQTPRKFLTKTDRPKIEKLMSDPLPEDILKVTAYMMLMCYCGLRFEDAMSFDYNTHIIDDERLIMLTGKQDVLINIKLYPKLREVVLFIREHPLKMSNKDFNETLKTVKVLSGIDTHITAHVGRHTFGRLLAENGIDKKKAQKLLGHRDERSTEIYYHMIDEDVDNEIDRRLSKL